MQKKVAKIIALIAILMITFSIFSIGAVNATENILETKQSTELIEMKESTKGKLAEYIEKYGSTPYGVVAYILNVVRIYSIPFCFIGITIGSIYQYVIGIRKLDIRDRGFSLIISFVTILLICQVLPLVFAIVVNGWRG